MIVKKFFRTLLIILASLLGLLLLFIAIGIAPTDEDVDYEILIDTMSERIDAADKTPEPGGKNFSVGFSKINLTPAQPIATGYGKRLGKTYEAVHDSIYVRSLVVDNGVRRVAIVSAELLIIPPTVTALLEQELPGIDFTLDNTYLGATHSHNSIGNWAKGAAGMLYGSYQDSVVRFITDRIKISIHEATKNMLPAIIKMDSLPMPEAVFNRIADEAPVDPLLRFLKIERSDSSKLLFLSYTAHATCLFSRDLVLSGDYPGKLSKLLESQGYALAMFMAGAVGSHGPKAPEAGWECIDWMAKEISEKIETHRNGWKEIEDTTIEMYRVPLALSEPQPKILPDWRIRPWLFKTTFGEYPTFISVLKLGDVVFLGTPCDFSGEFNFALDSLAAKNNVFPIVTSFNGGYIGYLTPEKYYDVDHHETQLMNWYGPGNGDYVEKALEKLMLSVVN